MNILVADDDEVALTIAEKILVNDGQKVLLANDGREALDIIRKNEIQIVISDWNMPNMDGIQLCRSLRSNSPIGYIYFIIVTVRNSKQDMLEGLNAGADDFITKPFEPAELLFRIRTAERILALETTSVTLFSLAKLAESKDTDTGKHLERIRLYARLLASQLIQMPEFNDSVPSNYPELLFQTSPLHDIGKVGIPDYVLLKPGSLNDNEWMIMKQHSQIGADTLQAALDKYPGAEFLRIARDIALSHHERWDGSGYPNGLEGTEIPLSARIVALADVYDALTMKRVYKTAMSGEVAHGIITDLAGKQFDPLVVQAFLAVEPQFIAIKQEYQD
ncbi:MAG: response regulator [Anaerolineales bacterium]|nr:response regulator [Anaerolineales bacterium]